MAWIERGGGHDRGVRVGACVGGARRRGHVTKVQAFIDYPVVGHGMCRAARRGQVCIACACVRAACRDVTVRRIHKPASAQELGAGESSTTGTTSAMVWYTHMYARRGPLAQTHEWVLAGRGGGGCVRLERKRSTSTRACMASGRGPDSPAGACRQSRAPKSPRTQGAP